jgi:acetyl esterase/lipase
MSDIWTMAAVGVATLLAVVPLRRPRPARTISFWLGYLINELPFLAACWLVAWTALALADSHAGPGQRPVVLALAVTISALLTIVIRRGLRTGREVTRALHRDLAPEGGRAPIEDRLRRRSPMRLLARVMLCPVPLRARGVERITNVSYGDAGRANRLDLYRHRSHPAHAPVLVHFHGGHFRSGGKSREGRALLHRLAQQGWVCISADYRLRRAGRFPASLIDAKRVIAWVREHADECGADPSLVIVAGSSAGAHLASMVALTPGEPAFQPGFESADTTVSGAVCLYGYYGSRQLDAALPSSPRAYMNPDAPPFFIAHGDNDTLIPAEPAADFADRLRSVSANPVVYAQLHGGQHTFDLVHSLRFEQLIDGIETFLRWVRASREADGGRVQHPRAAHDRRAVETARTSWGRLAALVYDAGLVGRVLDALAEPLAHRVSKEPGISQRQRP